MTPITVPSHRSTSFRRPTRHILEAANRSDQAGPALAMSHKRYGRNPYFLLRLQVQREACCQLLSGDTLFLQGLLLPMAQDAATLGSNRLSILQIQQAPHPERRPHQPEDDLYSPHLRYQTWDHALFRHHTTAATPLRATRRSQGSAPCDRPKKQR